jgi:hypothetical protein
MLIGGFKRDKFSSPLNYKLSRWQGINCFITRISGGRYSHSAQSAQFLVTSLFSNYCGCVYRYGIDGYYRKTGLDT